MVVKCCSCGAVRTSVIKLHGFPKETHLKEKWIAALKKKTHFSVTTYTRLCSQHFRDDDYYTSIFGSTILNPDAVPSKFFNSKKSLPSEPNNDSASKIFLNTEVKTVVSGAQTLQKQIIKQRISDDIVTQNKSNTSDSEIFLPDKEQGFGTLMALSDESNKLRTQLQEEKEGRLKAENNILRLTKKLVEYGSVENFLVLCEKHLSSNVLAIVKSHMKYKTRHPDNYSFNTSASICQKPDLSGNYKRPRPYSDNFDESLLSAKKRVCHDSVPSTSSWDVENIDLEAKEEVENSENVIPDEADIYLLSPVSSLPSTPSSWSDNDNDSNFFLSSPKKKIKSDQSTQTILNQTLLDHTEAKHKKKLTTEKKKNLELQKQFKLLQNMYDDLEKNSSSLSFFHSKCDIFLNKDFSNFVITQSKLMRQKSQGFRFPDEIKQFAFKMHSLGPRAYQYLQKYCHLPCNRTLVRLEKNKDNKELSTNCLTLSNVE